MLFGRVLTYKLSTIFRGDLVAAIPPASSAKARCRISSAMSSDISGPALGGIEGDNAESFPVLAGQKIAENGLAIGLGGIGLVVISNAALPVVVQNQIDGDFVGLKHCTSVRPFRGLVTTPWTRGEQLTRMLVGCVRTDGFADPCTPRVLKTAGGSRLGARGQIGYRVIVRRDGATVRLFTRRGHDWSERYPAIASAAAKLQAH
jgi:hypothetical protein